MVKISSVVALAALLFLSTASSTAETSTDAVRSISSILRAKNFQKALELARAASREAVASIQSPS